ncbi:MAG: hypothetical protein GY711_27995 [bacterium]|nr:hypothetical protein [bacterium]
MKAHVHVLSILACAPALGQWSTTTLPAPRESMRAVTVGSKALFASGRDANGMASGDIFVFENGAFSTLPMALLARNALTPASVGSEALFAGGRQSGAYTGQVEIFDAAANTWTMGALHEARADMAAASVGGYAIFAGGAGFSGTTTVVDAYDASTGSWSWAPRLSVARADFAATAVGPYALFAGGYTGTSRSSRVDIYDSSLGAPTSAAAWSTHTLSVGRGELVATTVGTKAIFAGGSNNGPVATIDIYDAALGPPTSAAAWSTRLLSAARRDLSATTVGTVAIFAGGVGPNGVLSAAVDLYDDATGTWFTASLSAAREDLAATSVGNVALFAGGEVTSGATNVVDLYTSPTGGTFCAPAVANSTGFPGAVSWSGSLMTASNNFTLLASQLPPGQFGYFLTSETNGYVQPPLSSGFLCLAGNVGRFNALAQIIQGPAGSLLVDLTSVPVNPPVAVQPGDTWSFQCWYRDVGATSNFTDALSVTFN